MNHPFPSGRSPSATEKSTALERREQAPPSSESGSEYTTLAEIAQRLHLAYTTVYLIVVVRHEIPHVRFGDRIRVLRVDLETYLAENRYGKAAS